MRFAPTVFALGSFCAFRSVSGLVFRRQFDSYPTCAVTCATTAITSSGCTGTGSVLFACACTSTTFLDSINTCVSSSCSLADIDAAATQFLAQCKAAGVTPSFGSSTASETGTSTGTAETGTATGTGVETGSPTGTGVDTSVPTGTGVTGTVETSTPTAAGTATETGTGTDTGTVTETGAETPAETATDTSMSRTRTGRPSSVSMTWSA